MSKARKLQLLGRHTAIALLSYLNPVSIHVKPESVQTAGEGDTNDNRATKCIDMKNNYERQKDNDKFRTTGGQRASGRASPVFATDAKPRPLPGSQTYLN